MSALNTSFVSQRRSLMWSILRIVRDPSIAEELTQEAYLRARKAVDGGSVDQIEAFLHTTAKNLAFDHQRRKRRLEQIEVRERSEMEIENIAEDSPTVEVIVLQRERMRLFEEAISTLSERTRQILVLSRVEGWSYPEIATFLGVSERTVFTEVKQGLAHCHDIMARRLGK